MIFVRTTRILL